MIECRTLKASLYSKITGLTDSLSDSKLSLCRPAKRCLIELENWLESLFPKVMTNGPRRLRIKNLP